MADKRTWATGAMLTGSLVAGGLAITAVPAAAGTSELRVKASDDAYTVSTRKTHNTGQDTKIVAGRTSDGTKVTYLKFTVGKLASGATLTGGQLRLVTPNRAVPGTLTVKQTGTNWTEKTLNAGNAPKLGTVVGSVKPAATDTVINIDVSKVVKKPGTYSFAVTSSATKDVARFVTTEAGAEGPSLRLTVNTPGKPTTPTTPPKPPTTPTAPKECKVDAKLVPSCGVLWGAAAGGFSDTPRDQAIQDWEKASGRTATIWHQYHKGDELFPTKAEIAMTKDAANPRTLLVNWKVAEGTTWAKVAAGEKNARIDRLAAYIKANFNDTPFFLAPHHEPENDVIATAGSGMTAKDYAKMYRHVVTRLKAQGVTNAINVVAYMGNEKWMAQSWWNDLYPGDDVVDWIGLDSYVNAQPGGYHYGDFADLLDRAPTGGGLGFYDWATTKHASKPLMIAEWGVYHSTTKPADKAAIFDTVLPELKKRPGIKAMVYFDAVKDDEGDRNLTIESSPDTLAAFQKIAADPIFDVKLR